MKILTIDSDVVVLASIKNTITSIVKNKNMGVRCDSASSKEEAVLALEDSIKTGELYDLVFLDSSVDEMNDGFEIVPIFKVHSPRTSVVLVIGSLKIDVLKRAKDVGSDGCIRKPISSFSKKMSEIIFRMHHLRTLEREFKLANN